MTEASRGEKRLCLNCAAKFFDLDKDPIKCPKCGAVFEPVPLPRSPPRRVGGAFAKPFENQVAVVEEADEADEDVKVSDGEQDEDDDERPVTAEEA